MPTTFESPRHERLTLHRADGVPIAFEAGRYVAQDEQDHATLRSALAAEYGVVEAMQTAVKVTEVASGPTVNLAPFPFERRTFKRGNESFVVAFVTPMLGNVVEPARLVVGAFAAAFEPDPRFTRPTASLRVVTAGGRCDIGVAPGLAIEERPLTDAALLDLFREAHVVVRLPGEPDAIATKAVAAGTPVIEMIEGDDAVMALTAALRDAEASYPRVSAQAAKAEKQLRATLSRRG